MPAGRPRVVAENTQQRLRLRAVGNAYRAARPGHHLKLSRLVKIAVEQTQILRWHAVQIAGRVCIAREQRQHIVGRYLLADAGHAQERSQGPGNDDRVLGERRGRWAVRRAGEKRLDLTALPACAQEQSTGRRCRRQEERTNGLQASRRTPLRETSRLAATTIFGQNLHLKTGPRESRTPRFVTTCRLGHPCSATSPWSTAFV